MSADVAARVDAMWHELGIPAVTRPGPTRLNGAAGASVVARVVEVARELIGKGRA